MTMPSVTVLCGRVALAFAFLFAVLAGASNARPPTDVLHQLGIPKQAPRSDEVRAIQLDLAWLGLLGGPVTGRHDLATRDATRSFTTSLGRAPADVLTPDQRNILRNRAESAEDGYGFARLTIDWIGARASLPSAILMRPELKGDGWRLIEYKTHHGANLLFQFDQVSGVSWSASEALEIWRRGTDKLASRDKVKVQYLVSAAHADSIVLKYIWDRRRTNLEIGQRGSSGWRFIHLRYDTSAEHDLFPVIQRVLRDLDLHAGRSLTKAQREARIRTANGPDLVGMPDWFRTMAGNGSGSIVSRRGHILTNHHVVSGCARVTVNGASAMVLGTDPRLDLAIVQSQRFAGRNPVRFREKNPMLGEGISVMGYPIFSTSQSMNYTRGYVSSTVGHRGDRSSVQITAPVQPGNSGGPVFDFSGRQVAVVASKAAAWFQTERNVENLAWAIRGNQALSFLRRNGLNPIVESRPTSDLAPTTETISDWRQVTVRIECHQF